jgi:hypothetical protein
MIFDVIDWSEDHGKLTFEESRWRQPAIIRTMSGEGATPGDVTCMISTTSPHRRMLRHTLRL